MKKTSHLNKLLSSVLLLIGLVLIMPASVHASDGNPPRVTTSLPSDITELPKTGVPLAAWALAALTPLGARLLKKNNTHQNEDHSPNTIWTHRQLKK